MLQTLEDVLYGAVTAGVNKPTVFLLNAALLACISLLVFLLGTSLVHNPPLALHFAVLLVFAVGLLASVNWVLSQVGIVSAEEQRKQLFGSNALSDPPSDPSGPARRTQKVTSGLAAEGGAATEAEPKKDL